MAALIVLICLGAGRAASTTSPLLVLDAHEDTLQRVLDRGHDLGREYVGGQADIPKWRKGSVNIVWFGVWVDPTRYGGDEAIRRAMNLIGALQKQVTKHGDDLVMCDTVDDCRRAAAAGKIAALIGIEGGIAINNRLDMLKQYRALGARRMNLAWRGNLDWAAASIAPDPSRGLTEFGREVVREMNRLGIIVDLSHASDQTAVDAIAASSRPVIFSHSNARVLADHPRNVSDQLLLDLKRNGGVIGVNFYDRYLTTQRRAGWFETRPAANLDTVLDHIDHIVKVAGVDHAGLGSDWDGDIRPAQGLESAARMKNLIEGLRGRGYTEPDIRKIAGENFLRVLESRTNRSADARQSESPVRVCRSVRQRHLEKTKASVSRGCCCCQVALAAVAMSERLACDAGPPRFPVVCVIQMPTCCV